MEGSHRDVVEVCCARHLDGGNRRVRCSALPSPTFRCVSYVEFTCEVDAGGVRSCGKTHAERASDDFSSAAAALRVVEVHDGVLARIVHMRHVRDRALGI